MDTRNSMRILVFATMVAVSAAAAQNQGQNQQTQNQQSQTQQTQTQQGQTQQSQQQQPQKKKGFWQRVKDAAQQGQNAAQNGQNTVQNTVQQGSGAVQNAGQQVQNGAQQGIQGVQSGAQGALPGNQGGGAVSGGGAGSCGQSCFDAGPFQANVSQMTMSQQGGWHVIRMNIQFHNSTDQPLIIAYHDGSMVMVDNNGNTYIPAGGNPGELQGMGIDRGQQTDSSFVLNPGQTGNALFSVARGRGPNSAVGTAYSYNLTIDELQAQNGALAIPVRQYNLNFPSLAPGANNAAAFPSGLPANGVAAGGTGTSYAAGGKAVPANSRAVGSQAAGTTAKPGTAVPRTQRLVNGRPAVVTHPSTAVNNVAMKTPAAMTARPSAAVKPVPAKAKATTPPKKKTASTTTTPPTK